MTMVAVCHTFEYDITSEYCLFKQETSFKKVRVETFRIFQTFPLFVCRFPLPIQQILFEAWSK